MTCADILKIQASFIINLPVKSLLLGRIVFKMHHPILFILPNYCHEGETIQRGGPASNKALIDELSRTHIVYLITLDVRTSYKIFEGIYIKISFWQIIKNFNKFLLIFTSGNTNIFQYLFKPKSSAIIVRANEDMNKGKNRNPIAFQIRKFNLKILGRKRKIIANSIYLQNKLKTFLNHKAFKIYVLYPKVDVEKLKAIKQRPSDNFRIGMIGCSEEKGLPFFKQLAKRLASKDVEFHIFGCSKAGLDGNLTRHGFANQIEIFSNLDLLLVPSIWEAFGRVSIESQICGIRVLVSNNGGLPETVSRSSDVLKLELNLWEFKVREAISQAVTSEAIKDECLITLKKLEVNNMSVMNELLATYNKSL